MAEKVKKEKAPAKPRTPKASAKTTGTTKAGESAPLAAKAAPQTTRTPPDVAKAASQAARTPSHEEIARVAYTFWKERGRRHGQHGEDWLRAERELKKA